MSHNFLEITTPCFRSDQVKNVGTASRGVQYTGMAAQYLFLLSICLPLVATSSALAVQERPNFLIILVDTCHVGKWHLNGDLNGPLQPQPSDHGFNHWFSTQNNALPNHRNPINFVRNGKPAGKLASFELYNLKSDIAEKADVKEKNPEVFARLQQVMTQYFKGVQDEAPVWPVWDCPRYESQQIEWPAYRKARRKK